MSRVLAWRPGSQRSLVMIGDANPHGVNYPQNVDKIDWKEEVKHLYDEMVGILNKNTIIF